MSEVHAHHPKHISGVEWAVAALGLVLVLGVVGFTAREALRGPGDPPAIRVRADSTVALGSGEYLVQFTARNEGHQTAADVSIVGELRDPMGVEAVETSRARVDFLPGRTERRGGLYFRRDPRGAELRLRAEGYQEP